MRKAAAVGSAHNFIESFDAVLRIKGWKSHEIEEFGAFMIQVVLKEIPRGSYSGRVDYLGADARFPGFSIYAFEGPHLSGVYTSNDAQVIFYYLHAHLPLPPRGADEGTAEVA